MDCWSFWKKARKFILRNADKAISIQELLDAILIDAELSLSAQDALNNFIHELHCASTAFKPFEMLEVLNRLLTAEINEFHLCKITDLCKKEPKIDLKVLQLVVSRAEKISTLTIQADKRVFPFPTYLEKRILGTILNLKRLAVLKISKYYFHLDEVKELCAKLPSLTHLDCKVFPQRQHPFNDPGPFKSCFQHLRVFHFLTIKTDFSSEFHHAMVNYCVQHLLRLRQVGDPNCFTDMTTACQLQEAICRLENLSVLLDSSRRLPDDAFRMMYHVEQLTIKCNYDSGDMQKLNLKPLLAFPLLRNLKLIGLTSLTTLEYFLFNCGKRLEELNVELSPRDTNEERDVRITMIRNFCPNLQVLILKNISNPLGDCVSTLAHFSNLHTLHLEIDCSANGEPVPLFNILSAPNLRDVVLSAIRVDAENLLITADMIQNGNILMLINRFYLNVNPKSSEFEASLRSAGSQLEKVMHEFRRSTTFNFEVMCII